MKLQNFDRPSKEEARLLISDLVSRYEKQRSDLLAADSDFTETDTRVQYIDRLLTALGWDVQNHSGRSRSKLEVVTERSENLGGSGVRGRPDYKLRIDGEDVIPVEAKKLSVKIETSDVAARQARGYGFSLSLPVAVLTNFDQLILFDTTIEPEERDDSYVSRLPGGTFTFRDLVSRFDDLWRFLSYESIYKEGLEGVYGYEVPPRGESPFDRAFLADVRDWRTAIAETVAKSNPLLGGREIALRAQKILNALIFLRVCEDRNLRKYEALKDSADGDSLLQEFKKADSEYNAGLFITLSDTAIDSEALRQVIAEMYWPKSQYAYGVLDPEIMAGIYDQYLGEELVVAPDRSVTLKVKPEVLHAGGVVSTPGYIVKEIVQRTIDAITLDAFPGSLPKILDPASGSGAFLIEAFRLLIDRLEAAGIENSLESRAKLARNCLFGIDIDPAATEVTRLGLLLIVLGDDSSEEKKRGGKLPSLADNIVSGNAVVRADFDALMPHSAKDVETRASVRPLDPFGLRKESPERLKFDFVIGNPPYVRIQEMVKYAPDQLRYLQHPGSGYESAQGDAVDLYQVFLERAFELVKKRGRIGMIIPNRFTNSLPAAPIRRQLSGRLEQLIHFRENQVFPGRLTYVAIVIVGGGELADVEIEFVDDLKAWKRNRGSELRIIPRKLLGSQPWPMATVAQAKVFEKLENSAIARMGEPGWVDIFVGVQTSADDYYFVQPGRVTDGVADFIDPSGEVSKVETELLRSAIRDQGIEVYDGQPDPDFQVIFPYREDDKGRFVPIPESVMRSKYPHAWSYFAKFRERLSPPNRSISPDPGGKIWAYGRSQSLNKLRDPKIIVRTLSLVPRYAIDRDGLIAPGGGDGGPYYLLRPSADCPYSIYVIQAILSHPAVDLYVAVNGKKFQGSYASHRKAFLKKVPVPELSNESQGLIESATIELGQLAERLRIETDESVRVSILDRRSFLKAQNDRLISSAFGITPQELADATGM